VSIRGVTLNWPTELEMSVESIPWLKRHIRKSKLSLALEVGVCLVVFPPLLQVPSCEVPLPSMLKPFCNVLDLMVSTWTGNVSILVCPWRRLTWKDPTGGGLPCNVVSPNDNANFVALLKALRKQFGNKYLVTIAASAAPSRYGNYLPEIAGQLDFINVMTYDFTGNWLAKTGLNSALYSDSQDPNQQITIDSAIVGYLEAGIPAKKLTLGVGFYGHSWQTISGTNNGLYQMCGPQFDLANPRPCPAPKGDAFDALWTDPCGATSLSGVWSWIGLRTSGALSSPTEAGSGWQRTWREPGKVPTLWNPSSNTFISYDDPPSIAAKVNYAKETGLGGVMVWEASQDYHGELMSALVKAWSQ
jgi:chitinase